MEPQTEKKVEQYKYILINIIETTGRLNRSKIYSQYTDFVVTGFLTTCCVFKSLIKLDLPDTSMKPESYYLLYFNFFLLFLAKRIVNKIFEKPAVFLYYSGFFIYFFSFCDKTLIFLYEHVS